MEFAPEFFQKETRCDFEIPQMMKRAWAAQLEVLEVVEDICERYGLTYFADWGTLLGAVRHQGFIPWDDDIDICLKREEYNELVRILPNELPRGFAMAGLYADSERLQGLAVWTHSRVLVDSGVFDFREHMERFHGFPYPGAGIDIFPLDYLPRDSESAEAQRMMIVYALSILQNWELCLENGELESRLQYMENLCGIILPRDDSTNLFLRKVLDSIVSLYQEEEADELFESPYFLNNENYHIKKEWYAEAVRLPFEQTEIAVPCGYHEVLTVHFGDYMTPVRDCGRAHTYPFYAPKEDELIRQIRANGFTGTVDEFCQKILSGEMQIQMF